MTSSVPALPTLLVQTSGTGISLVGFVVQLGVISALIYFVMIWRRRRRKAPGSEGATIPYKSDVGAGLCFFVGVACAAGSIYFLVLDPGMALSSDTSSSLGMTSVVNLQKLAIGQTLGVSAAVFLATAIRGLG